MLPKLTRLLIAIVALAPALALAQGACVPGQALTSRQGFSNLAAVVPGAQVLVSPGPIFTDQTDTTQAANPVTADAVGNYVVCAAGGTTQTLTVSGPNMNTLIYKQTFPASIQGAGTGSNNTFTGNNLFTGNNTFTGSNIFLSNNSFKTLQNVRYVSPTNIEGWAGASAGAWANAAAADLAGPGTVYFRSGSYTFTTGNPVTLVSGVQYSCVGYRTCTLSGPSFGPGDYFFIALTNVTDGYIGNFIMIGSGTATDNRGISPTTGPGSFTRYLIENNKISNIADGIDIYDNSSDNIVRANSITNFGNQGSAVQGDRNIIENNVVSTGGSTNLHHGFYIQSGTGNQILGNHISNVFGFCIHEFTQTSGTSISNNRVIGNYCNAGGLAGSGTRGGIALAAGNPAISAQAVIADNTITNTTGNPLYISGAINSAIDHNTITTYQGDCILVQSSAGNNSSDITLTGNVCNGGTVSGNGLRFTALTGGILQNIEADNTIIDGVFGVGAWLQACFTCTINGGQFLNYNLQASASNAGVLLDSGSVKSKVTGVTVSTVNTTNSPSGIGIGTAGDSDTQVSNNTITNFGAGPAISDGGTRTLIFGNKVNLTDNNFNVGRIAVATGVLPDGSGFKHKRVAGCATAASLNATCDTTVTWTTAFADANYTVSCTGDVVTSGVPIVEGVAISSAKVAASVTVRTLSITAAAAQFTTLDCIATHD